MRSFEERKSEIFARAGQMEKRRKARLRTALTAILLTALLAAGVTGIVFAQKAGRPVEPVKGQEGATDNPAEERTGTIPDAILNILTGRTFDGSLGGEKYGHNGGKAEATNVPKSVFIQPSRGRPAVSYYANEELYDALTEKIRRCFETCPEDRDGDFPEGGPDRVAEDVYFFYLFQNAGKGINEDFRFALWGDKLQDCQSGAVVVCGSEERAFLTALITGNASGN